MLSSRGGRRGFVNSGDTPSSSTWSISSAPSAKHLEAEREEILNTLMLSPNNKQGPAGYQGGSMSVPKTVQHGGRGKRGKARAAAESKQHRFTTGLNSKATNCAVCLGSVLFVKMAAKCSGWWGWNVSIININIRICNSLHSYDVLYRCHHNVTLLCCRL